MKFPRFWLRLLLFAALPALICAAELRGARSFKSGPIQITADGLTVWSVNPDNDSITRLNTATEAILEIQLPVGEKHSPRGLSIKEDGSEVWVASHDSDKVFVYHASGVLLKTISLPWGSGPYSIALSPDQKKALVTLHRYEALAVLDIQKREVSQILKHVFWSPMGVAWVEGGAAAWVNHLFAPGEHPLQTRVDFTGVQPKVHSAIRITPADPRNSANLAAPNNIAEGGYLNIRGHGAELPSTTRSELWLPTQYHNINNTVYTPDSSIQSAVRRINLSNRTLLELNTEKVIMTALHVHLPTGSGAYQGPGWDARVAGPVDLAFSRDGSMVYVLHELSRDLLVMPASTPAVKPSTVPPLTEISVGDRPIGLAVSPVANVAYVNNLLSRTISIIDLSQNLQTKQIPSTPVTGEPFSTAVLRGAKIFHTSDDPRISRNNKVSCASCHINAEHDGRTWAFDKLPGVHGPRSTSSLLGLKLTMGPRDATRNWGQLHRSGDRDEIQDFEHTFQGVQHGGTGFLGANVNPELGEPNAGKSPDLDALASYLMFLDPLKRSPHRQGNGALSESATRGATFFKGSSRSTKRGDAICATCHTPASGFSDQKFYNVGQRQDADEAELRNRTPAWNVNTPTLVGLWATPPYGGVSTFTEGHSAVDAMMATLLDYSARSTTTTPHGLPNGLTKRQLSDLAEFVLSIDGNMTAEEVGNARDITPPRIERVSVTSLNRVEVWFSESVARSSTVDGWKITSLDGRDFPVNAVGFYTQFGDHVTLNVELQPHTTYKLTRLTPIMDEADIASGGVANAMDISAPQNQPSFTISDRLTVTLGASAYENMTIGVHDVAIVGPGLATWGHDSVWLSAADATRPSPGFVRFDWRSTFLNATGVTNAADILDASFSMHGEFGVAQELEIRRCLQRWSDPFTGGDFNSNPAGAPTWNSSAHGTKNWNAVGAGRLGNNGTSIAEYFGANDLAARVDATVTMNSMNERIEFASPLVTDAFRFWFANPTVDYGYAIRLTRLNNAGTKFERNESGLQDKGPALKITYQIPGALPKISAALVAGKVRVKWPVDPATAQVESSVRVDGGWQTAEGAPVISGSEKWLELAPTNRTQFFRLVQP